MLETLVVDGVLGLYRLVGRAGRPLIRGLLRRRAKRGREDPRRLGERFGRAGLERPEGPLVWIHSASLGESLSALPLIGRIRKAWPGLNLLVTTWTVTSAELLAKRLPDGVIHQYVPIDLPTEVGRFLDHWRPELGLLIESELWPNLLTVAHERDVELILVNGRMSKASYKSWRRLPPLIRRLLALFSLTLAQTPEDQRHFRDLGAVDPQCLGNLKLAAAPLTADGQELAALTAALGDRPRWLAASTHPGEDELAAEAHARLAERRPGLLTLIVPRHPNRGPDIAQSLSALGLAVALRSAGEAPSEETEIYVADTIGELGLWYRLARVVFVGGSLVAHGGQNLLEPAAQGCAILCGPHTTNFARIAEDLAAVGALRRVGDMAELAADVESLLDDATLRARMGDAAAAYAMTQTEVLDRVFAALSNSLSRAAGASPRP
jgi:3-deoxy-D-manno-octulosonic-acid transferase